MDKKLFLNMIDCAINQKYMELKDLEKGFLYAAKEQTFLSFLWYVSKNDDYKDYYLRTGLILERTLETANYLDSILNDNKIPHIFLKGYHLKDLYPDPILRMCGDIDILVKKEDYQKVVTLFKNAEGMKDKGESIHDYQFKYKGVLIEVHQELFEPHRILSKVFNKPFDNVELVKNYEYKLNDNYNFLYIIGHYAKHINMGAGLRPLCDIYLMLTKLNLDLDYIIKELDTMGLSKFFNMVLNELYVLFKYDKLPFIKDEKVDEMIDLSLKSGVHGQTKNVDRVESNLNAHANGNKFLYIIKRTFISPREMFTIYPWTKSIILLPFGYIARIFYLIFNKSDKLKKVMQYEKGDKYYLMESIGLINEDGKIF